METDIPVPCFMQRYTQSDGLIRMPASERMERVRQVWAYAAGEPHAGGSLAGKRIGRGESDMKQKHLDGNRADREIPSTPGVMYSFMK